MARSMAEIWADDAAIAPAKTPSRTMADIWGEDAELQTSKPTKTVMPEPMPVSAPAQKEPNFGNPFKTFNPISPTSYWDMITAPDLANAEKWKQRGNLPMQILSHASGLGKIVGSPISGTVTMAGDAFPSGMQALKNQLGGLYNANIPQSTGGTATLSEMVNGVKGVLGETGSEILGDVANAAFGIMSIPGLSKIVGSSLARRGENRLSRELGGTPVTETIRENLKPGDFNQTLKNIDTKLAQAKKELSDAGGKMEQEFDTPIHTPGMHLEVPEMRNVQGYQSVINDMKSRAVENGYIRPAIVPPNLPYGKIKPGEPFQVIDLKEMRKFVRDVVDPNNVVFKPGEKFFDFKTPTGDLTIGAGEAVESQVIKSVYNKLKGNMSENYAAQNYPIWPKSLEDWGNSVKKVTGLQKTANIVSKAKIPEFNLPTLATHAFMGAGAGELANLIFPGLHVGPYLGGGLPLLMHSLPKYAGQGRLADLLMKVGESTPDIGIAARGYMGSQGLQQGEQ